MVNVKTYSQGDPELIHAVGRHITKRIGHISTVYDEIVSPDIHVDLYHVKPGLFRRHHTLVTSGMAELGMNLSEGVEPIWRHAELMMKLWPDWLGIGDLPSEATFWPGRMLKQIARYPHETGTWLGPGHTVQFAEEERWLQGYQGVVLIPPSDPKSARLAIKDGRIVNFYLVVPLYRSEIELKLRDFDAFFRLCDAAPYDIELVRPNRPALF